MEINFKELEIKNIDGTTQKVDIAKEMANVLYYTLIPQHKFL